MSNWIIYSAIGVAAIGLFTQCLISRNRHRRDFREHLEPILQGQGLEFISACYPGMFRVGPFPKIEIKIGRPQSHILGFRGEYSEFRVVIAQDANGQRHQIWAKLEFEVFRLRQIRWRTEDKAGLPPGLLAILEA